MTLMEDVVAQDETTARAVVTALGLDRASLSMLGTGIGYALGVKAARPDARVLLLSGDGACGFYPMEFDTALRHNLPIVTVVGNDAACAHKFLIGVSIRRGGAGKFQFVFAKVGNRLHAID